MSELRDTPQSNMDDMRDFMLSLDKALINEGKLYIEGWAIADSGVKGIEVFVGNSSLGKAEYKIPRPDVDAALAGKNAAYSGYAFETPWKTLEKPIVTVHFTNKKGETVKKEIQTELIQTEYPLLQEVIEQFHYKAPELEALELDTPLDIIIPVYNGYEFLQPLFDSLKANTKTAYRLIVIEDKSPDEKVLPYLKERQADFENFILLENEENKGFVQSVNRGFEQVNNHFVLLNTDVEVPPYWLSRLMKPLIEDKKIASITPFTNAGTICSFPQFLKDNPIFEDQTVDFIDETFQLVKPENNSFEIPTGIGFCMAVNKETADEIGMFDDQAFGKGYCEENDWCMRAIKAGYRNIMLPNLFVYHKHGGSFDEQEKEDLNIQNTRTLIEKHPEYFDLVGNFCEADPAKKIRNFATFLLASKCKTGKNILIIDHNIGGGANIYRNQWIEKKLEEDNCVMYLQNQAEEPALSFQFFYKNYRIGSEIKSIDEFTELIDLYYPLEEIFINNLVTFKDPFKVLRKIKNWKEQIQCKLIIPIHDYFSLCPSYNLINDEFEFCGVPNITKCKKCIKKVDYIPLVSTDIEKWRETWGEMLDIADEVICFSHASKDLAVRAYPNLVDKIDVIPHQVEDMEKVEIMKNSNTFNIGVLGTITPIKGSKVLKNMLDKLKFGKGRDTRVVVLGKVLDDVVLQRDYPNLVVTGPYDRVELTNLVERYEIDVFVIPSVWPETFSYTAEEIMKMELPIAVFDVGAPAERVKHYEEGIILEEMDGGAVVSQLWEWYIEKSPKFLTRLKNQENPILYSVDTANRGHNKIATWGWAYSPFGIETIRIYINDKPIGEAFSGYQREDISNAYDGFKEMEYSGFFFEGEDPFTPKQYETDKEFAEFIEVEIVDKKGHAVIDKVNLKDTPFNKTLHNLGLNTQYNIKTEKQKKERLENPLSIIENGPLVSLVVFSDYKFNIKHFTDCLESLKKQNYQNWHAHIFVPDFLLEEANKAIEITFGQIPNNISADSTNGTFRQSVKYYNDYFKFFLKGNFVGFLNANDKLEEDACEQIVKHFEENSVDLVYTDEDKIDPKGIHSQPYFKNDFNLDLLHSYDYISHAFFIKREFFEKLNWLTPELKAACFYDLILRGLEAGIQIGHLPKVLYHQRDANTIEDKNKKLEKHFYITEALRRYFQRNETNAYIKDGLKENTSRVIYNIEQEPLVTIIIPFKDKVELLIVCINSILEKTTYKNYKIFLADNGSEETRTIEYLHKITNANDNITFDTYNEPFNYSAINNWAVTKTEGDYILFLNNDVEVIEDEWLTSMVQHIQRDNVGAVGAKLLYDNNTLQHAGTVYGICGMAEHAFRGFPGYDYSRHKDMGLVRNVSICTAACLMVKRVVFDEIGGFDETNLVVAYNDVDLCLEIRKRGLLIVYTPYALLYHYESKSRGFEDTEEKFLRFSGERNYMIQKWAAELAKGDPYYNPNLTTNYNDYALKI